MYLYFIEVCGDVNGAEGIKCWNIYWKYSGLKILPYFVVSNYLTVAENN